MTDSAASILVVDDDPDITHLFSEVLSQDYSVLTAGSGDEALSVLQHNPVVAIVADHMMPGLSGVEVLQSSQDLQPHAARILITASQKVEHLREAVNLARIHRYLGKPIRLSELREAVSGAIREAFLEMENALLVQELQGKNELLNKALAEVQTHERQLEGLVAQRTKELSKAVAELEEKKGELEILALKDGLTGLYNHRFFRETLAKELTRAGRHEHSLGLVFLDVDHFKNYNDLCGHPAGDHLLRTMGQLLTDVGEDEAAQYHGRRSDFAARYGGEEFVILLPETDKENSVVRAQHIRATIEQYEFEGQQAQPSGKITVSIGVAAFPDDARTEEALLQAADQALYVAKRSGRNQVHAASKDDAEFLDQHPKHGLPPDPTNPPS